MDGQILEYSNLSASDAKVMRRWRLARELGFWRFTLHVGVMGFGMTVCVCMLVVGEWLPLPRPPSSHPITRQAMISAVSGFAFGALMWVALQRRYKTLLGRARMRERQ